MRRSTKKLILRIGLGVFVTAALVCAAVMFGRLRYGALNDKIKELSGVISAYSEQTHDVICVSCDLRKGTELSAEHLEVVSVSSKTVPDDAIVLSADACGAILRIDVRAGAMITAGMLAVDVPQRDVREVEFQNVDIGSNLNEGDVVDIRLRSRGGCDYVVVAKTRILKLDEQRKTVRFNCCEEEILLMDSAMVETLANEGSRLYLAKYVEENLQKPAIVNYVPSAEVAELIDDNPNVIGNN